MRIPDSKTVTQEKAYWMLPSALDKVDEYMTDWDKFKEMKLPPREDFYSKLNMSVAGTEDYEHVNRVWKEFVLKDLGEYHDLYLKTDVILLANVFEAFRKVCLKNFGLDPAHFYTAPGLAWKACLKKTGVRLKLLLDPDMLLMFERGIRGGITQSVHRWVLSMIKVNQRSTFNI